MVQIDENILSRIQKALNLAKSKNDEESQTAMLLAQRMMIKHGITMAELEEQEQNQKEREVIREVVQPTEKKVWWKETLSQIIAENFKCKVYNIGYPQGKRAIIFLGLREETDVAKNVYQFATEQMDYYAKEYVKIRKREARQRVQEWKQSSDYVDFEALSYPELERIVLHFATEETQKEDMAKILHKKHTGKLTAEDAKRKLIKLLNRISGFQADATLTQNEYLLGYLVGLDTKFKEQVAKEEWGLMLLIHALVEQEYANMNFKDDKPTPPKVRFEEDNDARVAGYKRGKAFDGGISERIE